MLSTNTDCNNCCFPYEYGWKYSWTLLIWYDWLPYKHKGNIKLTPGKHPETEADCSKSSTNRRISKEVSNIRSNTRYGTASLMWLSERSPSEQCDFELQSSELPSKVSQFVVLCQSVPRKYLKFLDKNLAPKKLNCYSPITTFQYRIFFSLSVLELMALWKILIDIWPAIRRQVGWITSRYIRTLTWHLLECDASHLKELKNPWRPVRKQTGPPIPEYLDFLFFLIYPSCKAIIYTGKIYYSEVCAVLCNYFQFFLQKKKTN